MDCLLAIEALHCLLCRRRLVKRIYIPMPDAATRRALLKHLLSGQPARLSRADLERIVEATVNYSGSDLAALCREAAIIPIRCLAADTFLACSWKYTGHSQSDLGAHH